MQMVSKLDLEQVLENASHPCYFLNTDWEFEFINKAAQLIIGKTKKELIGVNIWDALPKYIDTDLYMLYHKVSDEQRPQVLEILSEYSKRDFEVKVFPNIIGLFIIFIDITDRKESEKKKQYFDKLKIIGEMAAGVAHEVRNPLTTVKGFLQLMVENKELDNYKSINMLMIDEINRINEIITEFLNIAKDQSGKLECCNLNNIIKVLSPLLETRAVKEGKLIVLKLGTISDLNINKNEIRQLLLNMTNNALDAMDVGKKVQINTFEENGKVVLSIKDEGNGIPANMKDDISTPFVTTKEGGTGLGLPIWFSIAQRNNSEIDFTSSSEGSTFNIRFSK